jgi:adenylate cyclase
MSDQKLPEAVRKKYGVDTVDEMWLKMLTEGNWNIRNRRPVYGRLPSNPRCVNCHAPFAGPGGALLHVLYGVRRSDKNPRYCQACHGFVEAFPGGAEVELTMLFVDVRGSTSIAEGMSPSAFGSLMNDFYEAAIRVLVREDAFIDKLVGDEVTALFIPGFAGQEHAYRAARAGIRLLEVTGHNRVEGPWIPVGVGIHTGTAWVGSIVGASGDGADFTALGDNVNIAARLASEAGAGEILVSKTTLERAGLDPSGLLSRSLALKGKQVSTQVFTLGLGDMN